MKVSEIIGQIQQLKRGQEYSFQNKINKNTFRYVKKALKPQTALIFERIQFDKETGKFKTSRVSVTERNLQKLASRIRPYVPFQIDVIVGASGNWRSLFESALAYTPNFYACLIGGQRHLVWAPEHPHELNTLTIATQSELKIFEKQSRFYDYKFFVENCYPYSEKYEDFKLGIVRLLTMFRGLGLDVNSLYEISSPEIIGEYIRTADSEIYSKFHESLPSTPNFSLADVAKSYRMFLLAKQYFAYY